jgi:hypothetical protein
MAVVVALGILLTMGCGRIGPRQYEYHEQIDLSLDGSATVDVNGSIAALVALHGVDLDVEPTARLDREAIRALYEGPGAVVTDVSGFRRHGRRFVHVRLELDDVRRLPELRMFSWSRYEFERQERGYRFAQHVRPPPSSHAGRDRGLQGPEVGWDGSELIAFRTHLPSTIQSHNSPEAVERGNILVWEQPLADRLAGVPVVMEARMDTTSILSRTLWLFTATFAFAIMALVLVVWLIGRKGRSMVPA